MTAVYRLGLVLLAVTFGALATSIALVEPVRPSASITSHIFNATVWAVMFIGAGALLIGAAGLDRVQAVTAALAILLGLTSAYSFAAWTVVVHEGTGWQVASRITALAACHALLVIRGPELREGT